MISPVWGKVGQTVTLEGYADDYGTKITAMEFSLDGGETWARHSTEQSDPDRMVHWTFSYTPEKPGTYQFKARSVNEDGKVSPQAAVTQLHVEA